MELKIIILSEFLVEIIKNSIWVRVSEISKIIEIFVKWCIFKAKYSNWIGFLPYIAFYLCIQIVKILVNKNTLGFLNNRIDNNLSQWRSKCVPPHT